MELTGTSCIVIIILIRFIQQYSSKMSSILVPKTLFGNTKYFMLTKLLAAAFAALILLFGGGFSHMNAETALYAAAFGIMLLISSVSSLYAIKSGTMALSSLFSTAGLIVPCVAGIFMYHIPMSLGQWAGVLLFLAASVLLIGDTKKLYSGFSFKTLILLLIAMLSNGAVMMVQTMFAKNVQGGDVTTFSFLGFLIPGVLLGIFACVYRVAAPSQCHEKMQKKLLIFALISSIAVFFVNQLATIATVKTEPVILFTFINGGNTIIAAVIAALFFKEKITLKSGLGLLIGIAALIMVKAFQPA